MFHQGDCAGVVGAQEQETFGAQAFHKIPEGSREIRRGGETIGVVVFHVGDHGGVGAQSQKHAVILIGFDDEILSLPGVGVAAQVGRDAADDVGGVLPQDGERPGQHGGGGGLAVRPGHGETILPMHQVIEKISPFEDGDTPLAGGLHLRIVVGDGGGADDDLRARNLPGGVPDVDASAGGLHTLRQGGALPVGAADRMSLLQQDAGNGRKSGAADADEVVVHEVVAWSGSRVVGWSASQVVG